jgi:hypothetical protein
MNNIFKILVASFLFIACKEKKDVFLYIPEVKIQMCVNDSKVFLYTENGEYIDSYSELDRCESFTNSYLMKKFMESKSDTIIFLIDYSTTVSDSRKIEVSKLFSEVRKKCCSNNNKHLYAIIKPNVILKPCLSHYEY